ncbi:phosphoenolpyruvate synthase [Actinoallomurus rhizosphaericola]|uniref:phosphoenolpyruvate synthase n=1 Tax=Actinoallomurus rhizosphaericola TaxID=2952536 RepID=UPI002092F5B1|nr:phosphoenolpyruvate synthase [Actinoallomurus rhizosphaericola]MCO5995583.1 phosphoenolpyruvate synthase [Actinoallomurus rhizosphaericola]
MRTDDRVVWFPELGRADVGVVGGKNASLGELIRNLAAAGVRVPGGFATTAEAYREYLAVGGLRERVAEQIDRLHRGAGLASVGRAVRRAFAEIDLPPDVARAIVHAYRRLGNDLGRADPDVAVRSSATAEDLPEASFAGQQESFLNVTGEQALLAACRRCYASLFTDRAIDYRERLGYDHLKVALSIGVQRMVRSDLAGAGVMFSIDTESGFPHSVLINAAWGLGDTVVGGLVDPDEYLVFKPLLGRPGVRPVLSRTRGRKQRKTVYADGAGGAATRTVETDEEERRGLVLDEDEILTLARWATDIERHYGVAMDIEWAKDGADGGLFVVQARPETVQARREAALLHSYRLRAGGERLVTGLAIGDAIATGQVRVLHSAAEIDRFSPGAVLVTEITDPDWEPIMKRAAAIVTDHGGRTSHAAIVSRELGVPAIVGTGRATTALADGRPITVSCAEGDQGFVYAGTLDFEERDLDLTDVPRTDTKVMLNLANPAAAFRWWRLPADGVGLARIEFIVNNHVKIHPMALLRLNAVDAEDRRRILDLTLGYDDKPEYFVERLAHGVARIAASRWPDPVIVRMSDFKTNEYARLIGGRGFEPREENPMLGWRGASRYYSDAYRDGFALECRAIRRVRDEIGLTNVVVMIPFCRTVEEADQVLKVMSENGLARGQNELRVFVMAEIPSNVILADSFAERFDGFSIGSNDLTQLTLGVDRDSAALAHLFDERNPAVTRSIQQLIATAHAEHCKVGLCGQRPSDDPDFARILVRAGIDSISVTPDSFLTVKQNVAAAERDLPRL